MKSLPKFILRKSLNRSIKAGHPWVYQDAIGQKDSVPEGSLVSIIAQNEVVGIGVADSGPIAARIWTTRNEAVDASLIKRRLMRAAQLRSRVLPTNTTAYRIVNGEGDRMPGLVIDRYGDIAVMRSDGEGATEFTRSMIDPITDFLKDQGITTLLWKTGRKQNRQVECMWGPEPDHSIVVTEYGMKLAADLWSGQKTGLFLDHRESRFRTRSFTKSARVLNLYSYTGGFSVSAGIGGARTVTSVDIGRQAIETAKETWALNELPDIHRAVAADVPDFLSGSKKERFDVIISDPPSFAPNEEAKQAAIKSYTNLHAGCLNKLVQGGLYLAASCSSHIDRPTFDRTLLDGAAKAKVVLQVLDRWGGASDHPRLIAFPEGDYLKVTLCRVL